MTFAAYSYQRSGTSNSKQIVGDIYMHYNESTELSLSNAMPREDYMENKYFQFTIDGKNTNTKNDIFYDIILSHGDVPNGKTESNRIDDKFLRFRLVEVVSGNEEEIFPDRVYSDLTNKRIHVETIPKNTNSEVTHTYRLYMWIGYNVIIGNTDNANYSDTEWSNLFASIKVNVTGDFNEKTIDTPSECFTTKLTETDPYVNPELTNNELQTCISYFNNDLGYTWDSGEDATSFCNGTGTHNGNTFQDELDDNTISYEQREYLLEQNIIRKDPALMITGYDASCGSDVVIPSRMNYTTYSNANLNTSMTNEEIQTCVNYLTSEWGEEVEGDTVDVGETYQAFCNGTGTIWGETFQSGLDNNWFNSNQIDYFLDNNIITALITNTKYPVVSLGYNSEDIIGSFQGKNLTSVIIPNTISVIPSNAFQHNELTSIEIPSSVISIGISSFYYNKLRRVEIPNNVKYLGKHSFSNNPVDTLIIDTNDTGLVSDLYNGGFSSYIGITSLSHLIIGNHVEEIEKYSFQNLNLKTVVMGNNLRIIALNSFSNNQLTSVTLPNSVTTIGDLAFANNQLTSVTIPNSVTTIGNGAFSGNQLTSVTIGNGITFIQLGAFNKSDTSNPDLQSIRIDKTCSYVKHMTSYPWLSRYGSYTASGVTIYGSNNEVCDVF